jgi:hypothetical protein
MDQENISLMITLFVFLNMPILLLYICDRKRAAPLPWKSYPLCFFIVHGTAFVAGLFLGSMVDSTFHALAYIFQLEHETSAVAAKIAVNLMAVLASLSVFYVVRNKLRSALTDRSTDRTKVLGGNWTSVTPEFRLRTKGN